MTHHTFPSQAHGRSPSQLISPLCFNIHKDQVMSIQRKDEASLKDKFGSSEINKDFLNLNEKQEKSQKATNSLPQASIRYQYGSLSQIMMPPLSVKHYYCLL